ncbi:MAG: glucosaminidase domain-containing protein [Bacteroidales bacterium]|jgi:flagellum-specific peptidoglycan hydrolase FlgJ|nr:glucosaminidase domain-containing protein [Bacteroidales bacterium]
MDYKEQYISAMWGAIQETDLKGSFPSVVIAQGAVESNWGRSDLSTKYNNYFGIKKGSDWTGKVVNMQTGEVYDGQTVSVSSYFRVYNNIEQSLRDRISLLEKHYTKALSSTTPEAQIAALSGYATAPNYYNTVISIIDDNNLRNFDNIKYMKANTTYSIFLALGIAVVALSAYKLFKK